MEHRYHRHHRLFSHPDSIFVVYCIRFGDHRRRCIKQRNEETALEYLLFFLVALNDDDDVSVIIATAPTTDTTRHERRQ